MAMQTNAYQRFLFAGGPVFRQSLLLFCCLTSTLLEAAVRTPTHADEVLEILPSELQTGSSALNRLRQQWQENPQDQATLVALARLYIDTGRTQADPRYYGYAEALLQPWWQQDNPPADIQLLRAIIRQHQHEYAAAITDLEQLVKREPRQAQAWLTLGVIQLVQGNYTAAHKTCAALATHASTWFATLCYSQLMGLTGQAERAYQLQATLLPQLDNQQVELHQWVLTLLGETAWRLGKLSEANQHFATALQEPRRDNYLLRVYSDFLLSQHRPADVLRLLQDKSGDDALLLRLAIASRDSHQESATQHYRQLLEARYAAAQLCGSNLHARDEALYLLEFGGDQNKALALAQSNWQIQKEPEDTRLLLRAALAAKRQDIVATIQQWLTTQKQQDVRLQSLLISLSTGNT